MLVSFSDQRTAGRCFHKTSTCNYTLMSALCKGTSTFHLCDFDSMAFHVTQRNCCLPDGCCIDYK